MPIQIQRGICRLRRRVRGKYSSGHDGKRGAIILLGSAIQTIIRPIVKRFRRNRNCAVRWALIGLSAAVLSTASADTSGSQSDIVRAQLVAEYPSIQPGKPFWVAVRLDIEDGWYVNWINPGDIGLAPSIEWRLPEGFEASEILWPHPERFQLGHCVVFGYEKVVHLLTELTPTPEMTVGSLVEITADVGWVACREDCVPGDTLAVVVMPFRRGSIDAAGERAGAFEQTKRLVPLRTADWDVRATVTRDLITIHVRSTAERESRAFTAFFYPFDSGVIENVSPQEFLAVGNGFDLTVRRAVKSQKIPSRITGVLVADSPWDRNGGHTALAVDAPVYSR